jgi:MFS family permease
MHKNVELVISKSYTRWMIATLPASIAYAPLATLVPLYILSLGGTALYVALAVTAFNAVAMLATFVWGNLADSTRRRKPFIMLSYAGTTALLFMMYFAKSLLDIVVIYAAIALFNSASVTPYNLLVMETDLKENWSRSFSRFQAISNFGMVIGLIIAASITQLTGLKPLILIFAFVSMISTLFAAKFVIEPRVSVNKESRIKLINNIVFSMFSYPFRFIKLGHVHELRNSNRRFLTALKTPFALMCISWLLFNVGMSMFNTEYAASLHIHGLSGSAVFMIVTIAMIVQTVLFYYALRILYRNRLYEASGIMMSVRGISYILIAIVFIVGGGIFLFANLVLYTAIAGLSYPLYFTASYTILFMTIGDNKRGNALGIYNGIGWVGYFIGSFLTGAVLLAGFPVLYMVAGIWIFASIYVFRMVPRPRPAAVKKLVSPGASAAR